MLVAVTISFMVAGGCGGSSRRTSAVAKPTLETIERAEVEERGRRYDRARALYRRAQREAPDDLSRAYATRKLALALLFWGEYGPARRELERAVELRPDDVPSWHDLGIINHHLGDYRAAEDAFRQAIALRPREPRSRIALAALLWKQGQLSAAAREYRALLELELPRRIREKVEWAIRELEKRTSSP
jgi:tetratricopeptide (TPR) repeat protein